jgi:hypothetical protein
MDMELKLPSFREMLETFYADFLDGKSSYGVEPHPSDLNYDHPMVQLFLFLWLTKCQIVICSHERYLDEGFPIETATFHIAQECETTPEFIDETILRLEDCGDEKILTALDRLVDKLESMVFDGLARDEVSMEELDQYAERKESERKSEIEMMKEMFGE